MVVIEPFGLLDAEIQQLHFNIALDPTKALHQIVAAAEQASGLFSVNFENVDTIQSTTFQFSCYQGIDPIGLGMAFFALAVHVRWVDR